MYHIQIYFVYPLDAPHTGDMLLDMTKRKKQLTDRQLVDAAGGVQAVTDMFGFASTAAVYNWIGNDPERFMPKHWRMLLENKVNKW